MERELIRWLRERLPPHPLLRLGLGDDAAVLDMAGAPSCVLTVDMLTDGVDFKLEEIDARRAGRKALAVNLSDLAAMAARPLAGVVALCLPRKNGLQLAVALYEGMLPLAEKYGLIIAGGDTNSWDGPAVICVTLLGAATERGPLSRGGARPGDRIIVTGSFGGSILGRHLDFEPRVSEALKLNADYRLRAGMDVSDGLSLDLARLAEESGVGAALNLNRVPVADDARHLAKRAADGSTPLDHALSDGEDFELILAVEPDEARRLLADRPLDVPLTDVGEFIAEPGLWQIDAAGARSPLAARGWEHELR
ncbi:MAG: thiamine-monophosphate kinase [Pirellulaceae bacterium]|nr:thiamine-monophosphate kinase [Pirellulaceae bacterium]